jgi:F-type H+-transporting ATPase subunit gamma
MPNIKEINNRIASINSTQQITKAMKMVSAAKLAKGQAQLLLLRPFVYSLSETLMQAMGALEEGMMSDYLQQRPIKKCLLVVISADKGLCGSFNANVAKKTWEAIKEHNDLAEEHIDLMMVGKKACTFFQKHAYKLVTSCASLASQLRYDTVSAAAELLTKAFIEAQYDRIELIYNIFGHAASQEVRIEQFLPILPQTFPSETKHDHIYEPSALAVTQQLMPLYLRIQLYKALLESSVAEQRARMTTMSKATDNAKTLLKTLRITYNKTRQAAITNEILEIAAGAESLKG